MVPDEAVAGGRGLAEGLGPADWARMARTGVLGLSVRQGLALWDAAQGSDRVLLAPIRLDLGTVAGLSGPVPPLLRGLVRGPARRVAAAGGLAASAESSTALLRRLAGLPVGERERQLGAVVRGHVATVLGYDPAAAFAPDANFRDLGFDSLTGVELRNRLTAATGLRLPATLIFDHPTPADLAGHLAALIVLDGVEPGEEPSAEAQPAVLTQLGELESAVATLADAGLRPVLRQRLQALLARLGEPVESADYDPAAADRLRTASLDQLYAFVDHEFGGGSSQE